MLQMCWTYTCNIIWRYILDYNGNWRIGLLEWVVNKKEGILRISTYINSLSFFFYIQCNNTQLTPWYIGVTTKWRSFHRRCCKCVLFARFFLIQITLKFVLKDLIQNKPARSRSTDRRQVILWPTLIARFVGLTWGPSGSDRTQVGPMLPHELCYLGSDRQI